ncbi:MAG: hypothetical protein PVF83_11785 [Anaerolineales bacterium]
MKSTKVRNLTFVILMLVLCVSCQQGPGDSTIVGEESSAAPMETDTVEPTPTERFIQTGIITDSHGVPMVLIPAGEFLMGSERCNPDAPPHDVFLDGYLID